MYLHMVQIADNLSGSTDDQTLKILRVLLDICVEGLYDYIVLS